MPLSLLIFLTLGFRVVTITSIEGSSGGMYRKFIEVGYCSGLDVVRTVEDEQPPPPPPVEPSLDSRRGVFRWRRLQPCNVMGFVQQLIYLHKSRSTAAFVAASIQKIAL